MFDKAFDRVIGNEGSFQKDPRDRGNWTSGIVGKGKLKGTKFGIAAMTYPHLNIEALTVSDAKFIYRQEWWVKLGMERFRAPMQYQMFDAAINHGMYNATKILQYAALVKADGQIGPKTMAAVASMEINDLLMRFLAERLMFFTEISTFDKYGKGWVRRISHNLMAAAEDN